MAGKQVKGLLRLLGEYALVVAVVALLSLGGYLLTSTTGNDFVPALFKLRNPWNSIVEIVVPMMGGAILTRFIVRRRKLSYVVWREPEFVPPRLGGKAPTYAPPLDTNDDLLIGSALSTEPEPFYDLHVQPRISRLWWLMGILASLGAVLIIVYGLGHTDVTPLGAVTGMFGAFTWAFSQEYLLRGLIVAEMRRLYRRDRWAMLMSMLLAIPWMIPLAVTAATPTRTLVLILLGPLLTVAAFALRRMFTTLWAPIVAQFLFITVFFVLV